LPFIKANDINIHYEIHGEGFPLVMIMGLSANIDWWTPDFLKEVSKRFKVLIFDNRGAGQTDKPDVEYSIQMLAKDTISLMNALNIKKSHMLGISMGGMIAQETALNSPEMIEKLILCSTHCGPPKYVLPSKEVLELLTRPRTGLTPEQLIRAAIPILYTKDWIKNKPENVEITVKNMLKSPIPDHAYQKQVNAIMKFSSSKKLQNIKSPTLVMHGKQDILIPPKNAEVLAKLIPGAKIALFDNSAHALFSQETEKVTKTVIEFLK
jgi:pimeloyl-ACP methyl ester carboxylesterase